MGGDDIDDFEKWIGKEYEAPGLEAMDALLNRGRLSAIGWRSLARFVAAQDIRTPLSYFESMRRWKDTVPTILNECLKGSAALSKRQLKRIATSRAQPSNPFAESIQVDVSRDSCDAGHAAIRASVLLGRRLWLQSIRNILRVATDALSRHRWSIGEPHGDEEWCTTDQPVVRLNYYGAGNYDFGGGWANKGTEIMMPLDPRHLLYVQVGRRSGASIAFTRSQTELLQRILVERAHRWVFGRTPTTWVREAKPRVVDRAVFADEQRGWKEWHRNHAEAERTAI